jgi:hypothetical protein
MRYLHPLMIFTAIVFAALGTQTETESGRSAERSPASIRKSKPVDRSTAMQTTAATEAKIPRGDSLWPRAGERWIYRFERKAAADFGGKPWLKLTIGGRAAVEATDSAGSASNGSGRFFLVSYVVDRLEMQGQTRTEAKIFPGARIELDAAGKLRELRFVTAGEHADTITEEEADLVRDLTAQWLFFENHSRIGSAEVEWSTAGAPGPVALSRTVQKRVLRYPARPEISKLDSNHEWATGPAVRSDGSVDGGAKVVRIEGTENFTLASANGDFTQATSYRWLWTATEKTDKPAVLAVGDTFKIEDAATAQSASPAKKVDPAQVARDWPRLRELAPHTRLKLFRDAKRALDSGANELVSLFVRDVQGKAVTSIEWRTGVGALASSSNPVAAAALLALYRDPARTADEKLSILSGVAAGEGAPAPEWKQTFEASLDAAPANPAPVAVVVTETTAATYDPSRDYDPAAAVREASLYALGSSIRKETDATRRQDLETLLWKEIKDAQTDSAQTAVLEAIGNSGSGDYYAYVKESFAATNPQIRAKAVGAVRFLASDLAQPIIERAKADPAPVVRKTADWSAKFQASAAPDPN